VPKEKNVVLGYLEKKKTNARFSPRSQPWHDYYLDVQRFQTVQPAKLNYPVYFQTPVTPRQQ